MAREKRRFEIEDTRNEKYVGGGARPYLKLPPGLGLFKPPKAGTFRVDFIPFEVTKAVERFLPNLQFARPGRWYWERTFSIHEGIGPDRQKHLCAKATLQPPRGHLAARCPICEARDRLRRSAAQQDKDAAYEMRPRENQIFLVQPRNDRTGALEGQIQLWDIKNYNFGKQLDEFKANADPDDYAAYNRFYDPEAGMTVKILGSELPTGSGGKYSSYGVLEFKPRREPLPLDLFDHGVDLDACVRETPYDVLAAIFGGAADDEGAAEGDFRDPVATHPLKAFRAQPESPVPPSAAASRRGALRPAPVPSPVPDPEPEPDGDPAAEADPFDPPAAQEPEPAAGQGGGADFWVGAPIRFSHKGQTTYGRVQAVDEAQQMIHVPVAGRDRPVYLDYDEAVVVSEEEFAQAVTPPVPTPAPAAKPKAAPKPQAAAPKAAPPKPAAPRPAAPKPAQPSAWDDQE